MKETMDKEIRTLTSLSHDELIARIEQYQVLLECRHTEIRQLHEVIERRDATIMTLQRELEAIGAGGVSSQRITGTDARWYVIGADGMATLCINREDARDTAAEAAQLYPNNAPYTAVQMAPVGAGEAFGGRS